MPIGFVLKAWKWCVAHGAFIRTVALTGGIVAAIVLWRRGEADWAAKYKQFEDAHQAELQKIDSARADERRAYEENVKKLQAELQASHELYTKQLADLERKRRSAIEKIIAENGDDPVALAQKLSAVTGFKVKGASK